jgi:hypothetical protein
MSTLPHEPLVEIHTPYTGPSRGFRAACTKGCCHGSGWHATESDALDEARDLVALQEHGPSDLQQGPLEAGWARPA